MRRPYLSEHGSGKYSGTVILNSCSRSAGNNCGKAGRVLRRRHGSPTSLRRSWRKPTGGELSNEFVLIRTGTEIVIFFLFYMTNSGFSPLSTFSWKNN